MITKEKKQSLVEQFGEKPENTGASEVQVAIFTERIKEITEHLKQHSKDHAARLGLLKIVGKRRRLLNYIRANDIEKYRSLIKELGIRK